MSAKPDRYWPPVESGKTLSPEQLLTGLESKWAEWEKEDTSKPSPELKRQILYLARRITAHRTTQGKAIKDILPRLIALFGESD